MASPHSRATSQSRYITSHTTVPASKYVAPLCGRRCLYFLNFGMGTSRICWMVRSTISSAACSTDTSECGSWSAHVDNLLWCGRRFLQHGHVDDLPPNVTSYNISAKTSTGPNSCPRPKLNISLITQVKLEKHLSTLTILTKESLTKAIDFLLKEIKQYSKDETFSNI